MAEKKKQVKTKPAKTLNDKIDTFSSIEEVAKFYSNHQSFQPSKNTSNPYQNSVYLKYNVFFEVYCNHTEKVYLEYTSIHVGKLHGVYFKYYIFWTIKYTLSILPFFVLISILEVYFSAYCLSLFSSVYLKYTSVHPAFLCSHQYT